MGISHGTVNAVMRPLWHHRTLESTGVHLPAMGDGSIDTDALGKLPAGETASL